MTNRTSKLIRIAGLSLALALAACGKGSKDEGNLANLDNQLVGNDVDPALASAINDQIMVDPSLANQSNRNAVRPPETPTQAQYPADGAGKPGIATAAANSSNPCAGAQFDNNIAWAQRLNAAFPLYPGAKVSEAAGQDRDGCRERVVSFTTGEPWQRVIDFYSSRARNAGYSVEQQTRGADQILGGTNDSDGGAYYLIVTPVANGGSDVSLISNNGR